ncbi:MAG: peptidoglycan DD-metalloendopeptidase family protein [Desulfobaccales bacterium]
MFPKGAWFIIAGVLLLAHTVVQAEPYLKVWKDGVVYYHFTSWEPNRPRGAGKHPPKLRGEAWVQVPSARPKRPAAAPGATRGASEVKPAAVSCLSAAAPAPFIPETPEAAPAAKPYAAPGPMWAGSGFLMNWLTKLGCRSPLVLPASAGHPRMGRPQEVPAGPAPEPAVPEGWKNLLKYAQESPPALAQVLPGPAYSGDLGAFGYRFPVAGPFSFRDTWGEARSGGRMHRAVDIFALEGSPVYAITAGVIDSLATLPEAGISLFLRGQDGRGYGYMHLQSYAAGLAEGKAVRPGDLIGYVGRTGVVTSAAHLHFQVYADHRLCRDELLNPYGFLVQLCQGIGVTDLNRPKLARLENPGLRGKEIQVYRRPNSAALKGRKNSSVLVINNF